MKEKNKYTLITGASSGIGYESSKLFASKGKNLIIVARTKNNLIELKSEILKENPSLDIIIKNTDLSVVKNVYELYNSLKDYNIESLINNAGFGNYDNVVTQNLNKIETMLDLNVKAVTILSSLFVHDYKDVEGTTLINLSSAGGYTLVPNA
ncbi:SDR family NAD(P)-dependent oxidoreductase, partial [Klebsiella pneumoniae]|nr:SDR family NAD(P)-dependent oxidoreductase [Klebsiella pneumoniae]